MIKFEFNDFSSFFTAPSSFKELMENLNEEIDTELKDNEEFIIIDDKNNIIKDEEDYNILKKKQGDIKLIVQKGDSNDKKLINNKSIKNKHFCQIIEDQRENTENEFKNKEERKKKLLIRILIIMIMIITLFQKMLIIILTKRNQKKKELIKFIQKNY